MKTKSLLAIAFLLSLQVHSQIPVERATNVDTYMSKDTAVLWTAQVLYMGGDQYQFKLKYTMLKGEKPRAVTLKLNENPHLIIIKHEWGIDGTVCTKTITSNSKEVQFLSGTVEWDKQKWNFLLRIDERT